eukprot:CAMPEP_0203691838 /NCGR_PEP_ID=MMETSP0091-20130426/4081_1 /ASSEMBLY_ACC=CAM_ASM_001089 /TAXON_ID=426623 /ORGANISM="Chaetoceros affinis, Strain CCMP159" /LENGTH=74 /DNA_ID=CAMNT_0050562475 /DNA_START=136 /DNA_END=360 /DNA_ORIENTATION=-
MNQWFDVFGQDLNLHLKSNCADVVDSKTHLKVQPGRKISKPDEKALESARESVPQTRPLHVDDVGPVVAGGWHG